MSAGDQSTFERIAALPLAHRLFMVLTAAVVEEILFRSVPLTVGPPILGGLAPAAIVAVAAFVLAHFRWKPVHLIQVAVAGAGLCVLFVLSGGDLWACIIAHLIVDAVGFLLVPAILRLRRAASHPDTATSQSRTWTIFVSSRIDLNPKNAPDSNWSEI